ncbi:hypothetical protein TNCV_1172401 [Trichonephila clavipes]|uniref:Uncharacterized protein n=1 Tax=Trichonephila clavipes TaxID=2585209 RepID=A0A8X6S2H6_TRICX|nr:hypothetical protein TNCV_1172401 [Trichonephila clavipes]
MNQASALEAQTQQRSLNSSLGDTVDSPLVHLGGQLLNGSRSKHPKASPQSSFNSVIYGPWCSIFVWSLSLNSPILPCMVYFYHGDMQTVHKLSRFGNAFSLGSKVNDHVLLDIG